MRRYAGIGHRETPANILMLIERIAVKMKHLGWWLESGGAEGCDTAFWSGAHPNANVWLVQHVQQRHLDHAAQFHPAWDKCSDFTKRLHARNSIIMLGISLNNPVNAVICYTKNGKITGGTGQALRIAEHYKIPVSNIGSHGIEPYERWINDQLYQI